MGEQLECSSSMLGNRLCASKCYVVGAMTVFLRRESKQRVLVFHDFLWSYLIPELEIDWDYVGSLVGDPSHLP